MSVQPPPLNQSGGFNTNNWVNGNQIVDEAYIQANFLAFPSAQGAETLQQTIINGDLTVQNPATFSSSVSLGNAATVGLPTGLVQNAVASVEYVQNYINTDGAALLAAANTFTGINTFNANTNLHGLNMNQTGIVNVPNIYMDNGTSTSFISQESNDNLTVANDVGNITMSAPNGILIQPNSVDALSILDTGISAYLPINMNSNALSNATCSTQVLGSNNLYLANTAFVAAGLSYKASTASPTFTGVPNAPTAALNTNSTQQATTAFVQNQINTIVPVPTYFQSGTVSISSANFTSVIPNQGPNIQGYGGNNFIMVGTINVNIGIPYGGAYGVAVNMCSLPPYSFNSGLLQIVYATQLIPVVNATYFTIWIYMSVQVSNPSVGIGIPSFNANWFLYPLNI